MNTGVAILLIALVAATAFGVWRRLTDGRIRGVDPHDHSAAMPGDVPVTELDLGTPLGQRATLLQFSTSICQPCRVARRTLTEVAAANDGVAHVEIDAEHHLDLVRRLDVMRTPTIFVLDNSGRIRHRVVGAPQASDVRAALAEVV